MKNRIRLEKFEKQEEFCYIAQLVFDEKVMNMNFGRTFTQEEAEGYYTHILEYNHVHENAGCYKVFLENDNSFIGIASLWAEEDETEVDYMVLSEYWNHGYATEILGMLVDIAKLNPSVSKISGLMDPANIPSKKVLIKNGFSFEKTMNVEENNSVVEIYSMKI